jgi:exodeoxyribonuclease VII large subunit
VSDTAEAAPGIGRQEARSGNLPEFSVSELSSAIKRTLEGAYGYVRLRGEISGFRGPHASGHCYFALKDDKAKIDAVIWRAVAVTLKFRPAEGLEVIATGRVTSYPGRSTYQIVIDALEPAGIGALMALLEERRKRLTAEGLFDDSRKRKLPFLPRVIGLITSPSGAVIRDMLHGFAERFPSRVVLWPVRVQGETCALEVAAAIAGFNAFAPRGPLPRPDMLIVARGGGSLEDLWGFNEEVVVRAAAASAIPVVSAVGHETDWTLIDFAADVRAPTPTKAAEWAVPKHSELLEQTGKLGLRLGVATRRQHEAMRAHLRAAARGLPRLSELLALPRQRCDALEKRLPRALTANSRAHAMRLARATSRLQLRLLDARMGKARDRLEALARRAEGSFTRLLGPKRARLERAAGRIGRRSLLERLQLCGERLAACDRRMHRAFAGYVDARRRHLAFRAMLLASLSYQGVLQRGFALVRDASGRTLRRIAEATPGKRLEVELGDGRFAAEVSGGRGRPEEAVQPAPAGRRRRGRRGDTGSDQGSLF